MEDAKLTEIYNPQIDKKQMVRDLKVKMHDMTDEQGEPYLGACVEYIVVGHNREWRDWQHFKAFKAANPAVEI